MPRGRFSYVSRQFARSMRSGKKVTSVSGIFSFFCCGSWPTFGRCCHLHAGTASTKKFDSERERARRGRGRGRGTRRREMEIRRARENGDLYSSALHDNGLNKGNTTSNVTGGDSTTTTTPVPTSLKVVKLTACGITTSRTVQRTFPWALNTSQGPPLTELHGKRAVCSCQRRTASQIQSAPEKA